ncbi:hypothetical protein AB0H63_08790 [Micromonospora echinospora]|uniref:hypothetical protein n=1 Tax=Micromonospora echinospora TaxID=1877 RepID=UPI0033F2AFA4
MSPGSVHSTLIRPSAESWVIVGSPDRRRVGGWSASSPESARISSVTRSAGTRAPVGSRNPTAWRSPERQPARKASTLFSGPSPPEHPTSVVAVTTTAKRALRIRRVRRRRGG